MTRASLRALLTAPLLAGALALSACGGDDTDGDVAQPVPTSPAAGATTPAGSSPAETSPAASSPAGGGDSPVATTPAEAQNAVFTVLAIVETCWAESQDYTKCAEPATLGNLSVNFVKSNRPKPGQVAVTAATKDTFKIIGTSAEGNLYVLSKGKDGNVKRKCKLDSGKACPASTW